MTERNYDMKTYQFTSDQNQSKQVLKSFRQTNKLGEKDLCPKQAFFQDSFTQLHPLLSAHPKVKPLIKENLRTESQGRLAPKAMKSIDVGPHRTMTNLFKEVNYRLI